MNELQKSHSRHIVSSACSSEDQNRSTVKRLYSSVFSIIDNDQEISYFSQCQQLSRIERLVQNAQFMSNLQNKMRIQGLCQGYNLPILRVSLYIKQIYSSDGQKQKAELDKYDIQSALHKFGDINKIIMTEDKKDVYVFFNSFVHTYICYKLLNSINIRGGTAEFNIQWVHNNGYHSQIATEMHNFINKLRWESLYEDNSNKEQSPIPIYGEDFSCYGVKQNKFTCRYDIQIQNQRQFQVARRIIGSKGCNMKRIIEESVSNQTKNNSNDNLNEILKLRLRGKGSGYKEGTQQQESTENLHLCVSAKDQVVYNLACEKVQKLLSSIYLEFFEFSRRQGKSMDLSVKKIVIGQSQNNIDESSTYAPTDIRTDYQQPEDVLYRDGQAQAYRILPQKIEELLELRNKARRELNFSEADRIRNYLRSCGVCLIDEKGRRGKAAEVTTWKYIY